ncbi:MAG: RNA polymerase sigma factor [Phycisphaerae bacterium]|nr:RNA polymerase sigma factor [Phycisphaerae bacterium]
MRENADARIARAVAGDARALEELLAETAPRLRPCIANRVPSALQSLIDADDIVQDAQLEVIRRIRGFESRGRDSFRGWVATIALNRLRSMINAHRASKRGGGLCHSCIDQRDAAGITGSALVTAAGPDETPDQILAQRETVAAVTDALRALPAHYREAIRLVQLKGCSVKRVADQMGRTERAIHGLIRRGLALLRRHLADERSRLKACHATVTRNDSVIACT